MDYPQLPISGGQIDTEARRERIRSEADKRFRDSDYTDEFAKEVLDLLNG